MVAPSARRHVLDAASSIDVCPFDYFDFPELTTMSREQVDFCIRLFKACIPQMVTENRTPFIHHFSYQYAVPHVFHDLLGVSAMYHQKTPRNETVIFSMVNQAVCRLIKSSESATATWSPNDYLVGVQALILYQIIRLFDGDIRQRANAEGHFAVLEAWTSRLQSTNNIFHNDLGPQKRPYEGWVFIESTRRTITMSILLQALYSVLKDGICTSVPLMATLPVSTNGALWGLSEQSWWLATSGLGSDLFTYHDLVTQWNGGLSFHTGIYEAILLAACRHNLRPPSLVLA